MMFTVTTTDVMPGGSGTSKRKAIAVTAS